jgi:P27 family predicted phage terminase small subunit
MKPTAVKVISGTARADRINSNEPDYVLLRDIPEPPKYLSKVGRDVYYSTAEELLKLGILNRVSLSIFVMYCGQVAIHFEAIEKLSQTALLISDKGDNPKINPYIKIANDSLMASVRIACEFGITPASSSKVSAVKSDSDVKGKLLEKLMRK